MRVLWFCNTPSLFQADTQGYNGGGWISSLEQLMSADKDLELGISFLYKAKAEKTVKGNVTYYPLPLYASPMAKLKHHLFYGGADAQELKAYLEVIADFAPDIIHVFGTEGSFGLVAAHTKIPVVLHIQGLLNPCWNAMFPPGTNARDYFRYTSLLHALKTRRELSYFKKNALRETLILKSCQHFLGRTQWDKAIVKLYAPDANYYACNETLRPAFYEAKPWQAKEGKGPLKIVSVISQTSYKGFDLILKTANLLKQHSGIDFSWEIHGLQGYPFWEKKLAIKASAVSIRFMGVSTSLQLIESLQKADLYVHPSYVDNSPNSLCEAQLLGIPVLATQVGGIPSLIEDGVSGLLFPVNDPYILASKIVAIASNTIDTKTLSENGRKTALERHNPATIVRDNRMVYSKLLTTFSAR